MGSFAVCVCAWFQCSASQLTLHANCPSKTLVAANCLNYRLQDPRGWAERRTGQVRVTGHRTQLQPNPVTLLAGMKIFYLELCLPSGYQILKQMTPRLEVPQESDAGRRKRLTPRCQAEQDLIPQKNIPHRCNKPSNYLTVVTEVKTTMVDDKLDHTLTNCMQLLPCL